MATSWLKSFAGQGSKVRGAVCLFVFIITVLLNQSALVTAIIGPLELYSILTVRIGEDVKIPFEFCLKGRMPSCNQALTFNLSAPNPSCTSDHHGHCQINAASEDHPERPGLFNQHECELCELTVQQVQREDIGQYNICQLPGCVWQSLTLLEIENDTTPKSSASEPVSTTKPGPADLSSSVSTTNDTITEDRSEIRIDPGTTDGTNYAQPGKLSSTVGIPVTVVVIIILIICGALYLYKRRNTKRQLAQYNSPNASPLTSPNTTTVLNFNVNNADGCSIEINGETAHFREDPEFNT